MVISVPRRRAAGPSAVAVPVPEAVRTLAVLLQAGAAPLSAWRHLADAGIPEADEVVSGVEGGRGIADALRETSVAAEPRGGPRGRRRTDDRQRRGAAWRQVASAWAIAATVGAPLGDTLRVIADSLDDAEATRDDVRIALAEPAGSARLMMWLPVAGLLLGTALGFDTLVVLLTNPIGMTCLAVGSGLIGAARIWTTSLVRAAEPPPDVPGIRAELLAIALAGGASIARARALLADEGDAAAPTSNGAAARGGPGDGPDDAIDRVLRLAEAAGVPAVELLRADATRARREARVAGRTSAARLSARLLLPLGVCTLPAFLLLGVAPLVLSVLTTTPLPVPP
ncbi:type II secretion system F family protein [Microbacterium resistens]